MKMRRGWYFRWADDPFETNWRGTCPVFASSMRAAARRTGRKLIETPIRVLTLGSYFCIECQTTHS